MPLNLLTETTIKNAKPQQKPVKLFDGGGLFLLVHPKGGRWWRFKYAHGGREQLISFGIYPDVTLRRAREKRDEAPFNRQHTDPREYPGRGAVGGSGSSARDARIKAPSPEGRVPEYRRAAWFA